MGLRAKLVLALVVISVGVAAVVGGFSYRTTSAELNGQIDKSLRETTDQLVGRPSLNEEFRRSRQSPLPRSLRNFRSSGDVIVQIIGPNGITYSPSGTALPVDATDEQAARATGSVSATRDVDVDGVKHRMMTVGLGDSRGAVQAARSLVETRNILEALRTRIILAALIVSVAAALIGWLIAHQMTERLVQLTAAAEGVTSTRDPSVQVPVSGSDETARLGTAFNKMLMSLSQARQEQQRLVQNAGHELRTPLTSLRTNVFALTNSENITDDQRRRILADLRSETEELTVLINEVVDLATDSRSDEPSEPVALGELVEQVVARARQRSSREFRVYADQSVVLARRSMLARAIGNLVENAVKFDPTGAAIDVTCANGRVEVADHGPGFGEGEEQLVFERFYRADSSRSLPGSGLGLAIVADVVSQHGGNVYAANRPGGGAVIGFQLPTLTVS